MECLMTSGQLYRMFLSEDPKTIIRRPNCRKFCLDNNINIEINQKAWLIDYQSFMSTVNPLNFEHHYTLPRMRNLRQCVNLWNSTHRWQKQMIDKHMVERFCKDKRVFAYHHGNRWIINYDQLEPLIAEYIEKNNYKIKKRRRRKK